MKKIQLLLLALVAMISANVSAQTYEANLIRYSDLNAMTEGQSKTILLACPSTTSPAGAAAAGKGYFLGSAGNAFSHPVSYTDDNGATNNVITAANTAACRWIITKTADAFTIKDQDGNYLMHSSLGVGANADEWTVPNSETMSVNFQDTRTDIAKSVADVVRFVVKGGSNFLNQDGPKLAGGTGGWSYWLVLEVSEAVSKTYTVVVTGCTDGRVVYDDAEYADGSQIENVILDESKLSAKAVDGYNASVAVDGTTITATYTAIPYPIDPTCWDSRFITAIGEELTGDITPSETQWYIMKSSRETVTTPAYDAGVGQNIMRAVADNEVVVNVAASAVAKYLIRLVPGDVNGAVYMQFGTGNFFPTHSPASGNGSGGNIPASADNPGNYRVYPATQTQAGWVGHYAINYTTADVEYGYCVDENSNGGTLSYWGSGQTASGKNNIWALYPVTVSEPMTVYQITYNYKYNNEVFDTETKEVASGNAFPAPKTFDFAEVIPTPEGTATADQTFNFDVNFSSFPFTLSSDFETAKWNTIKMRYNRYVYYDAGNTTNEAQTATDVSFSDEYQWAFIGNPTAFKIVNKAAGITKAMKYIGELKNEMREDTYTDFVAVKSNCSFTGETKYTDGTGERTIFIKVKDAAMPSMFINLRNNTMAYWNSTNAVNDSGSALEITEIPDAATYTINIYGDPTGEAKVTVAGNQYANGDQVTCSPTDLAAATCTEISNFGAKLVPGTDVLDVTYYVTDLAGIDNNSVYTLTCKRGQIHYKDADAADAINVLNEEIGENCEKFALVQSVNGNYYMYSVGGEKFIADDDQVDAPAITDEPVYPVQINASGNANYPQYFTSNSNYFNIGGTQKLVVSGWNKLDDGNQFEIVYAGAYDLEDVVDAVNIFEGVKIFIGDAHWTTFVAPFEIDLNDAKVADNDLYAFTVGADGSHRLVATTDYKCDWVSCSLPENLPVIIYCEDEAYGTSVGPRGDHATLVYDFSKNNYLVGVLDAVNEMAPPAELAALGSAYLLQKHDDVVGFYKFNPETSENGISLLANRALLVLPNGADAKDFIGLEDDPTAINGVNINAIRSTLNGYNVSGVRVGADYKGVVIVNGKKVLNK